jgi:hypothetical protein
MHKEGAARTVLAANCELQERLKSHARAFEGLMSLIPAKDYYGKDESITSVSFTSLRGVDLSLTPRL